MEAFDDLTAPDALQLLGKAPDPDRAARLSTAAIATALRRAHRRDLDAKAARIQATLRAPQLRQPTAVQAAYAVILTTQVRLITALNAEVDQVADLVAAGFDEHPEAKVYLSQPGLGPILSARVLAEFGDDPKRFTDAKAHNEHTAWAHHLQPAT